MQQQFKQKENPLNSQEAKPNFWQSLEKNQKIALIALAVFVLFLMVIWTIQFRRSLTEPFAYKGDDNQEVATTTSNSDIELKSKDTDGDGLSDWDELNIYKTSPYLEDSDGDGIKDEAEIKAGTNPNCPEGKECVATSEIKITASSSAAELFAADLNINKSSSSESELKQMLEGAGDATKLRQILLDAGMDKKILDQVTDEELMINYQDLLNDR